MDLKKQCVLAVAIFSISQLSCDRVETYPSGFPVDPFADAPTYQEVLNYVAPGEWTVETFHRLEKSARDAGIVFALSRHTTKDEFLFLYHFPGGRNGATYSVAGARGAPQPVVIDARAPTRVRWKSRKDTLLPNRRYWEEQSEKIGNRYPIHGNMEDITVKGRFGNYQAHIVFDGEKQEWKVDVDATEES